MPHTPGKWRAQGVHVWVIGEGIEDHNIVDRADAPGGRMEAEANARLIAEAPAMYEALKQIRRAFYVNGKRKALQAAIEPLTDIFLRIDGNLITP